MYTAHFYGEGNKLTGVKTFTVPGCTAHTLDTDQDAYWLAGTFLGTDGIGEGDEIILTRLPCLV